MTGTGKRPSETSGDEVVHSLDAQAGAASIAPEVTVHGISAPWPGPHFAMVEKAKQQAYAEGYRHYRTPDHEGIDKDLGIGMSEIWQEAEIAQRLMDDIGIPVPEVGYGGDVDVRVAVLILRLRQAENTPGSAYIYRAEALYDGEWTPITPPSYHRPEREMLEQRVEDEDHDTFTQYRIVRVPIGAWESEPERQPCVVANCLGTADEGDVYCGRHEVFWGRGADSPDEQAKRSLSTDEKDSSAD